MASSPSEAQPAAAAIGAAGSPAPAASGKQSYGQILKSSALVGGSSIVTIVFGMVRTKAMALLLEPAGFGFMGLYGSIADTTRSIAGMGVNSSGVRQIAEAAGSGEEERIGRTLTVLRRAALILGILGAVLLVALCKPVSALTFGDTQHAGAIALLSLAVLFRTVSDGQGAVIQGMRRIADLARSAIVGAVFGTIASILLVYFFHEDGVVPSLVAAALISLAISWWYSRKVKIRRPAMSRAEVKQEAAGLLKLGVVFMVTGLMMTGAGLAVRVIVLRVLGSEATGLYQAAWTLGGLYIGFILQAMGADFYPRLTAVASRPAECNRLVNEQAEISLLLAGPGVIATLTFAPIAIALFYSAGFTAASEILRWICLGATLQVISWPMGFIIVAQGKQKIFFWCELAYVVVHLGLAWFCVKWFRSAGAGIAFFGSYLFHVLLIYPIVRRLTGFQWSAANRKIMFLFLPLIGAVFSGFYLLPRWAAISAGTVAAAASGIFSIRILARLVHMHKIPRPIRQWLVRFRLAPADWRGEYSA
jgi:O-antigen/teichoic acid export membrane protein